MSIAARPPAYQPHIDGLRTFAVLAVLWAHFCIPGLPGGFLGVDVFFVISGFLITRLILSEKDRTGRFSYSRFYLRRLRRLMPAALATVAASLVLFYPVLGAKDLVSFLRSVPFSIAPLANINLYREIGYFDTAAQMKPLLHFWSLAVEEQFYFFWPTVLLAVYRWPRLLHSIALIVLLVSLAIAQIWLASDPSAAYYLLPSRAFELMIGASLALAFHLEGARRRILATRAAPWIAAGGMAAILLSYALIDEHMPLPGVLSLGACLGTAAVIAFGDKGPVGRVLMARPVVWIGLISYSLYLVHWPIYVYVRYRLPDPPSVPLSIALVGVSIAVAALSYALIEKPLRHPAPAGKRWGNLPFLAGTLVAAGVLIGPTVAYKVLPGTRTPAYLAELSRPDVAVRSETFRYAPEAAGKPLNVTRFTPASPGPVKVLVIGDSHAGHLRFGLRDLLAPLGVRVDLANLTSCPPLFGVTVQDDTNTEARARCSATNPSLRALATSGDYDVVTLASRWALASGETAVGAQRLRHANYVRIGETQPALSMAGSRAVLDEALADTVQQIRQAGARVVLLGQVPPTGNDLTQCQALFPWARENIPPSSRCAPLSAAAIHERLAYPDTRLAKAANGEDVLFIGSERFFCDDATCRIRTPGTDEMIYNDSDHLTKAGSVFYLDALIRQSGLVDFLKRARD